MANLSNEQRAALWADLMRRLSQEGEAVSLTKPQLRAAVDAADAWADAAATSYNNALPAEARNNLTAKQKAMLLMFVIAKRFEVT